MRNNVSKASGRSTLQRKPYHLNQIKNNFYIGMEANELYDIAPLSAINKHFCFLGKKLKVNWLNQGV